MFHLCVKNTGQTLPTMLWDVRFFLQLEPAENVVTGLSFSSLFEIQH